MTQSEDTEVSPDSRWKSKSLLKLTAKGTEEKVKPRENRTPERTWTRHSGRAKKRKIDLHVRKGKRNYNLQHRWKTFW